MEHDLIFFFFAMNAGKSTSLLQSAYNYAERGMNAEIFTAALDDRFGKGKVASRIGLASEAHLFNPQTDMQEAITSLLKENKIDCLFIDEAQFLTKKQVQQLIYVVDKLDIPVLAYGLRTDFFGRDL